MRMRPLSEISAPIIRSTVRSYDRRPVRSAQSSFTCLVLVRHAENEGQILVSDDGDAVGHPREAMEGSHGAFIAGAGDQQRPLLALNGEHRGERAGERATGALHGDGIAFAQGDLDVGGDGNWLTADARHSGLPPLPDVAEELAADVLPAGFLPATPSRGSRAACRARFSGSPGSTMA